MVRPPKLSPEALAAAVPPGLRALDRWVGYARRGAKDKVPVCAAAPAQKASVDDPSTYASFEVALAYYRETLSDPEAGIGFVFRPEDGLHFIDLDHVLGEDGKLTADGRALVTACGLEGASDATYCEVSPSGAGLHLLLVGGAAHRGRVGRKLGACGVELYPAHGPHYATFTGRQRGSGQLSRGEHLLASVALFIDGRALPGDGPGADLPGPAASPAAPEPARRGEAEEALSHLDPDLPYEQWLKVGMALRAGVGEAALPAWVSWSAQGRKWREGEPEEKWRSFGRSGVGLGSLLSMAREAGWRPEGPDEEPEDVFEVLPPEDEPEEPAGELLVTPLSRVQATRVDWLWRGRLALGHLALVAGDGGQGKSILTLDLAARVSSGRPLPGETVAPRAGRVLLFNTEDGQADTLRPRAEAAGADLERVVVLDLAAGGRPPQLPDDVDALDRLISRYSDVSLVVLDPLNTCLPVRLDSHKDQHVRQALWPLMRLAERRRVAVALVVHLRKANDAVSALYKVSGSIGIGAAARSVLFVGPDPDDEEEHRKVVAQAKPQLGPPPPGLAFEVVGSQGDAEVGVVRWLGESSVRATDLTERPDRAKGKDAGPWLESFLAGKGPTPAAEVMTAARAAGYGRDATYRAATTLGVVKRKSAQAGWTWALDLLAEPD